MDDQDRTPEENASDALDDTPPAEVTPPTAVTPPADADAGNEGVPIPPRVRASVEDVRERADAGDDDAEIVREYESRYNRDRRAAEDRLVEPPVVRKPAKAKRWDVDANERRWAALAHASTLLTAAVALPSIGTGALVTIFIPLLIYLAFRKRSDYVAFHALQAFAIQLVGTVGWFTLFLLGSITWVVLLIVSLLLILLVVGFVLFPVVLIVGGLALVATFALPILMVIYSVIATIETWNGHDYRYPYIARWIERQLVTGTA